MQSTDIGKQAQEICKSDSNLINFSNMFYIEMLSQQRDKLNATRIELANEVTHLQAEAQSKDKLNGDLASQKQALLGKEQDIALELEKVANERHLMTEQR